MNAMSAARLFAPLFCAAIVLACGADPHARRSSAPPGGAGVNAEGAYNQACYSMAAAHQQDVKAGRHRPGNLIAIRWPGRDKTVRGGQSLPEVAVAGALADGRVRSALVLGAGGTGKSELARMIEAIACGKLRVVRLSLPWRVVPMLARATPAENIIMRAVAAEMKAAGTKAAGADPKAAVNAAMAGRPWLAVLDGLDEVALHQRPRLLRDIEDARKSMADMRLAVLARPPVFRDDYGMSGLEAVVELPALPCAEAERVLAGAGPDDVKAKALRGFVARFELDRKQDLAGQCVYPHMSSWRDLAVIRSLARVYTDPKLASRTGAALQRNRAGIYHAYLKTLLLDDLVGQDFGPDQALQLVDAMVDDGAIRPDARTVALTLPDCLSHVGADDDSLKRARCQALLQSTLFVRLAGKNSWHFANQSIADLFLARRLDRKIAAKGPTECAAATAGPALDASNEIAGFLLGLPRGRRCAPEVLDRLCDRAESARLQLLTELSLPGGMDRAKLLLAARKRVDSGAFKPCVAAELRRLWQALPAPLRAEASRIKP